MYISTYVSYLENDDSALHQSYERPWENDMRNSNTFDHFGAKFGKVLLGAVWENDMRNSNTFDHFSAKFGKVLLGVVFSAIAVFILAAVAKLGTGEANATEVFSRQTRLPCAQCHVSPAGGGKLTAKGQQFKANGYKLPK